MATKSPAKSRTLRRPSGRLTVKVVAAALRKHSGIQSRAAESLGIDRSTICRFIKTHPQLLEVIDAVASEELDVARGNLSDYLNGTLGDDTQRWQATKYYLDNMGQRIGFGVRKMAFSDGEGNVVTPGVLVTPAKVLTPEEWEARHAGQA